MSCGHFFRVHLFAIGAKVEVVPRGPAGLSLPGLSAADLDFVPIDAVEALMVGLFSDFGGGRNQTAPAQ